MFIRRLRQTRNGRAYTYYSLVETVRAAGGSVRQRTICYLGRLDNLRPPDWLRIAERLPDPAWLPILMNEVGDTPPPPTGPISGVWAVPDSISWTNPRRFGDVYVALRAWQHLGLDRLLERLLGNSRAQVPMPLVAAVIGINRLVDPRSERGIHHWLPSTALPELLGFPGTRLSLNHLYRCLSLVEPHKPALEKHLAEQGRDLFQFRNDLLLYDLTSTYFEGRMADNPKAQRGYSRDHRPDCKQLCIGLVVNREGFPLGYESLAGKARDAATLWPMIETLEARFGRSSRILCFDRGMATEANLRRLRQSQRPYLCATRRAVVRQHLPAIRSRVWTVVRTTRAQEPAIEVQELPATEAVSGEIPERWLLCRSAGCRLKEQQMYQARLDKARQRLAKLQAQVGAGTFTSKTVILTKAKKAVGRTHDLRGIFSFTLRRSATGQELQVQENATAIQDETDLQGVYLLRSTAGALADDELWHTYMVLTRVEIDQANCTSSATCCERRFASYHSASCVAGVSSVA
jgi:Transposase DDE domain